MGTMQRIDALTSVAMALMAGIAYTVVTIWVTGHALAVAWPEWYTAWAEHSPGTAMQVWNLLIIGISWLLPGALLAWLMVGPGRLRDWRYAWLAPLPAAFWIILLPFLEGRGQFLLAEFVRSPVASAFQAAVLLLSMPLCSWLFFRARRRKSGKPAG